MGGSSQPPTQTDVRHLDAFPTEFPPVTADNSFLVTCELLLASWPLCLTAALLSLWAWWTAPEVKEGRVARSTDALDGLRTVMAFWVFLEHLGIMTLDCSGAFITLSGSLLSMSRVTPPFLHRGLWQPLAS